MPDYSTQNISEALVSEIVHALKTVSTYGSVEIYIQNSVVTQITVRNIKKTSVSINHTSAPPKKMRGTVAIISHIHT